MSAATFGYARVSTGQQSLDQQLDALNEVGVSRVFSDKMSGAKADRPGLVACMDHLRAGDVLVVVALDRLGRSTLQVLSTLQELHERGVVVRSLRESLDFSTPLGQAVATTMSALAEMELALIRERAAAAREAARTRGKQTGRPRALNDDQMKLARRMHENGEHITVIAQTLKVSRATIYRATA
ncbi:recombinase family protein [Aeromicrobium fastidiosum]|uniref:recombinase family protein n=1 Tax=Aeromicrobium fastidiosum TaxID=52699 RepID=UPI0020231B73|nr:recombinase family protein [Aeromicrobium fastidiosum]MCL8251351.1 recombinase family protein [Aeromicrobium fastidiosum]